MTTHNMRKIILSYGIGLGMLSIALFGIVYFTNHYIDPPWWNTLGRIISVLLIIYLGLSAYKNANGGILTLKKTLKVGLLISLVAGFVFAVFNLFFTTTLVPEYVSEIQEATKMEVLEQNANMPQEQLEMTTQMTQFILRPPMMAIFGVIGALFYGFLASLLVGFILKTPNNVEKV